MMLNSRPAMMLLGLPTEVRRPWWSSGRSLQSPYQYKSNNGNRQRSDAVDFFGDIMSFPFYSTDSWFQQFDDHFARLEKSVRPRYAISNSKDSKAAELTIELPGVTAKDISVELENGNVLRVHGSRTVRENGSVTTSQFDHSFTLDTDVDVEKMSVTLSSGILTITAPKKETSVKRVPLTINEQTTEGEKTELQVEKKAEDPNEMAVEAPAEETPAEAK